MTDTNNMTTHDKPSLKSEIRIIRGWAVGLAIIIFSVVTFCFFRFVWGPEESPPAFPVQVLITLLPATLLAVLALMIGYVNQDAGRRGMSRTLWTIIVICVPNAIGFILYFLLRSPLKNRCPECATIVDVRANYCPRCRHNFHPTCAQCKSPVRPNDAYCPNCGSPIEDKSIV